MKAAPLSKETVSDSSSSLESEEESTSSEELEQQQKKSKEPVESTGESTEETSDSGSEDESSEEQTPPPPPSTKKRVTIQEENTVNPVPTKAYKPPPGFQFMQKSSTQPSDISQLLSNLDGKQLWHITAPIGIPVSSIESLAMDAITSGEPVLTHKGTAYKLQENQLGGSEKQKSLLVPDKNGNVYRRHKLPVSRTYHLEQVVKIPQGDSFHANGSVDISALTKKPPKQPQHLQMRYKPFGSADQLPETIGWSDEEPEPEAKQFKMPKGADIDRKEKHKKRKQDAVLVPDEEEEEEDSNTKKSLPIREDGEKKKQKKAKKSKEDSPEVQKKSSKKHRDETEEERRARKEERKKKKQSG
ncbi:TPA_exp: Uncharacterized protein A8136_2121 [Trichophyton benhamiae CBS 112371]|uniref:Uncharacterized protein n=1 Tax=Arthroderma benhamiae (strain ATCC MYA-4681 / CBS 112371) TaxID=663331 RepID=D4AY95_ARTBC|nr:uncharacterized protein ARB_01164 [Trichophyton benhamiae CBS 112371]EFE31911.1 conserved hypothetical protein [Trichophyton benhamiae CBS 112371]DAA75023.1 TPA_exp: Uncharacterized protein A8136_2121 [Trichophyton benhamiae CBS 112371]